MKRGLVIFAIVLSLGLVFQNCSVLAIKPPISPTPTPLALPSGGATPLSSILPYTLPIKDITLRIEKWESYPAKAKDHGLKEQDGYVEFLAYHDEIFCPMYGCADCRGRTVTQLFSGVWVSVMLELEGGGHQYVNFIWRQYNPKAYYWDCPICIRFKIPVTKHVTRGPLPEDNSRRFFAYLFSSPLDGFPDLKDSYWAFQPVKSLLEQNSLILISTNPGNFEPEEKAKIYDVACWLALSLPKEFLENSTEVSPLWYGDPIAAQNYLPYAGFKFADCRNDGFPITGAAWPSLAEASTFPIINASLEAGIIQPDEAGRLHLQDNVTRAQFCEMAVRAFGLAENKQAALTFWDLKDPRWAKYLGVIRACTSGGFMEGYPDGSFFPEGSMTRAEVAVAIYKLLGNKATLKNPNQISPSRTGKILDFKIGSKAYFSNGVEKLMDVTPTIMENRAFIPLRFLSEELGWKAEWEGKEQKVTLTASRSYEYPYQNTHTATVELWVGSSIARLNGKSIQIDPQNPKVTPFILSPGRTMIPLRFVSEALGARVGWIEETQEVIVVTNN